MEPICQRTSGASHLGLVARTLLSMALSSIASSLDRLKSATFTRQLWSTSRLGDLRSLQGAAALQYRISHYTTAAAAAAAAKWMVNAMPV